MMKKKLFLALAAFVLAFSGYAQRNCGTMEVLEQMMKEDPLLEERMTLIEEHTQNAIMNNTEVVNGVITIPVVVHVLYNTSVQNISTAQINSQIAVLNNDFRRLNADASNTPTIFQGVASDVEIQFCLATIDPSGNATTGITRTQTTKTSFGTNNSVKYDSQGGKNAWPRDSYLNIWVCNIGGGILGYAQFPGGAAATDGVVCGYQYFGTTGTATAPFNLGRTATHEVGHWLNLRHIWGDGGCSVDDLVSDTPLAGAPNYTGSPCTFPGPNSCNSGTGDQPDQFQNYMDYSDDGCMNLFTTGQKSRMRAIFDVGGFRAPLLNSVGCGGTPPAPTCTDGIQNGTETGIDCGGSCPPCQTVACNAPASISVTPRKQGREATIAWTAVSGASSYELQLKRSSTTTWGNPVTTTGVSIKATGLTKNVSYDIRIRTNCGTTQSVYATKTFIAGQSARQTGDLVEFNFYPNPANDLLTIELTSSFSELSEVLVMDMSGKIVVRKSVQLEEGANAFEIDLSDCTNGVYILTLTSENLRENIRVSVLK
jgi:hypothetical protein